MYQLGIFVDLFLFIFRHEEGILKKQMVTSVLKMCIEIRKQLYIGADMYHAVQIVLLGVTLVHRHGNTNVIKITYSI